METVRGKYARFDAVTDGTHCCAKPYEMRGSTPTSLAVYTEVFAAYEEQTDLIFVVHVLCCVVDILLGYDVLALSTTSSPFVRVLGRSTR